MPRRPSRIDLLELDIDLRIARLWREANDISEWNLDVVGAFIRAAYGDGYCDALSEDEPGSLCVEHGYRVPDRRPCVFDMLPRLKTGREAEEGSTMSDHYLRLEITSADSQSDPIVISDIGPFETENDRAAWVKRFQEGLKFLNEQLGLTDSRSIGAKLQFETRPSTISDNEVPPTIWEVLEQIEEHYQMSTVLH